MQAAFHDPALVVWRPIVEGDVETVARVESASHTAPWSQGNFRDAIHAGYGMVLGEYADQTVAYGVLMLGAGEAQLLNLTVSPQWRRHGVGRTLLRMLLREARDRGALQCFLEVRVSNQPAISLYTSEGFAAVARRAAYYPAPDGREDALVMRRPLA